MEVSYSQGNYNFPIYDAEYNINGSETVRPVPSGGSTGDDIAVYWDDSNINEASFPEFELNGCTGLDTWSNFNYGNVNTMVVCRSGSATPYLRQTTWFVRLVGTMKSARGVPHSLWDPLPLFLMGIHCLPIFLIPGQVPMVLLPISTGLISEAGTYTLTVSYDATCKL